MISFISSDKRKYQRWFCTIYHQFLYDPFIFYCQLFLFLTLVSVFVICSLIWLFWIFSSDHQLHHITRFDIHIVFQSEDTNVETCNLKSGHTSSLRCSNTMTRTNELYFNYTKTLLIISSSFQNNKNIYAPKNPSWWQCVEYSKRFPH